MLVLWENHVDAALLAPEQEVVTLPASNVQNPHISRRWHTPSGQNLGRLIMDLGAIKTCGLLSLQGSNMRPGSTFALSASITDPLVLTSLVLQTGSLSAGMVEGYGSIYFQFTAVAARYWKLEFQDVTLDHVETGRIILGPKWVASQHLTWGWQAGIEDKSRVTESYGGQEYVNILPIRRTGELTLNWMTEAQAFTNAFSAFRKNGLGKDMLIIPLEASQFIHEQAIWGLVRDIQGGITADSKNVYVASISIRERL